jgi:hypothetical protein
MNVHPFNLFLPHLSIFSSSLSLPLYYLLVSLSLPLMTFSFFSSPILIYKCPSFQPLFIPPLYLFPLLFPYLCILLLSLSLTLFVFFISPFLFSLLPYLSINVHPFNIFLSNFAIFFSLSFPVSIFSLFLFSFLLLLYLHSRL